MSSGSGTVQHWSKPEQYTLSPGELRLVEDRARRRIALKSEYQRIAYNPYKHMLVEGGLPFDPIFQRFASTRADYYPYFKPNRWNFLFMMCTWIGPFCLITYIFHRQKFAYDARCRNAEIPWRYRPKKFD